MQKQLNPELFGEVSNYGLVNKENNAIFNHITQLEQKVGESRHQVALISEHFNKMVTQINEFVKSTQMKIERLQQSVVRLEQNDQAMNLEASQKISQISQRLGERKTLDLKIQEMVDRHNGVLRSFEVRLGQMQKMMNEKEAMLVAAQTALNEAKMELSRLKRM